MGNKDDKNYGIIGQYKNRCFIEFVSRGLDHTNEGESCVCESRMEFPKFRNVKGLLNIRKICNALTVSRGRCSVFQPKIAGGIN